MAHGHSRVARKKEHNVVHADPKAVESRQEETPRSAPHWKWITERSAREAACLDILRGKPGLYPIFGIQLAVEQRSGRDGAYPVLVYCDAMYGDEGQNLCGLIEPGFAMSPILLTWDIRRHDMVWKSESHELLTRTLLGQPEMQFARDTFFREREAAEREREAAEREAAERERHETATKRSSLLEKLRSTPAESVAGERRVPPKLKELKEILAATWGTFDTDGLTVLVCRAPKSEMTVVRVKNVREGHAMHRVAKANVYARQDSLTYSDDLPMDTERNEMQQLSYELRTYLRGLLIASGVVLTPPQPKSVSNGNGHVVPSEGSPTGKPGGTEEVSSAS